MRFTKINLITRYGQSSISKKFKQSQLADSRRKFDKFYHGEERFSKNSRLQGTFIDRTKKLYKSFNPNSRYYNNKVVTQQNSYNTKGFGQSHFRRNFNKSFNKKRYNNKTIFRRSWGHNSQSLNNLKFPMNNKWVARKTAVKYGKFGYSISRSKFNFNKPNFQKYSSQSRMHPYIRPKWYRKNVFFQKSRSNFQSFHSRNQKYKRPYFKPRFEDSRKNHPYLNKWYRKHSNLQFRNNFSMNSIRRGARSFYPASMGGRSFNKNYSRGRFRRKIQKRAWRLHKKPYWRRKSYRHIKLYNRIFKNQFKIRYRKKHRIIRYLHKRKRTPKVVKKKYGIQGKTNWYDYYRRSRLKYWFRNRIILRIAWMNRYGFWTQRITTKVMRYAGRKTPALLKFWQKYEFTLDKYVTWWQIVARREVWNDPVYVKRLIKNGYIYVNFVPITEPKYPINQGDCIFFLNRKAHKAYFTNRLTNLFKTKFRRSYSYKAITRQYRKKFSLTHVTLRRFYNKYLYMKRLKHWAPDYFQSYMYFVERSYKYRIIVNLHQMNWATLNFAAHMKSRDLISYYSLNSFVNRRFG